jgi:hypothetical protein
MSSGMELLPAAKLQDLLQKHATADCLVSFVGVPALTPEQIAQLPSPRPKVVAAVVFNPPSKAMFAGKVLYLAALPKSGADQADADGQYQIVTPETADSLLQ